MEKQFNLTKMLPSKNIDKGKINHITIVKPKAMLSGFTMSDALNGKQAVNFSGDLDDICN